MAGRSENEIESERMMETRRSSARDYTAPSYKEATETSERRTSQYDSLIIPNGPKFFRARQGSNTIRILPPTWANARHYSYEVRVHNDIGVQKQQYLCLAQNEMSPDKHCPLCDERNRSDVSYEDKERLRAKPRNYIYLVDRWNQGSGVLLWSISTQSDKEILLHSLIKRTQEYLPIAHIDKGYDVDFHREGEGLSTRYRGFMVSRESTPLSTNKREMDDWIDYIDAHPIPEILQFFSAEHIRNIYEGHIESAGSRDRDRDDPRDRDRGNGRDREERRETRREEQDEPRQEEDRDTPPWNEDERQDKNERLRQRLNHDNRR